MSHVNRMIRRLPVGGERAAGHSEPESRERNFLKGERGGKNTKPQIENPVYRRQVQIIAIRPFLLR